MMKKAVGLIAAVMMLVISAFPTMAAYPFETKDDVTPSKTDYHINLENYYNGMISNKTPVEMKKGKYYYMVYTVESVKDNQLWQNGIIATKDAEKYFDEGTMHYLFTNDLLFEAGATYFYRFEMTEDGLSYVIAKVDKKGKKSYIELPIQENDQYKDCKYFGVWLGGNGKSFTGSLSQVLCYDSDGNDLGVVVNKATGAGTVMNYDLYNEIAVPHSYEFSLKDAKNVAISNERGTKEETIFMSFDVKNVKSKIESMNISGGIVSTAPQSDGPHGEGIINYEWCEQNGISLLHEGSHYLVRFDRNGGELKVTVKETAKNGKISYYGYPVYYGTYRPESEFFSIYYGVESVSGDFSNFKCYDTNGKNLAVQINKDDVSIQHIGNWEDYSMCKGVYYNRDIDTLLILDDENNIARQVNKSNEKAVAGTYVINNTTLTMSVDGKDEKFEYLYDKMTDESGTKYMRLKDQKVKFVADTKEFQVLDVNAKTGYKVEQPDDPTLDGYAFKCWCLNDGTEYDFENIVTETMTLYAKYEDGNGHEYIAVDGQTKGADMKAVFLAVAGVIIVGATVLACVKITDEQAEEIAAMIPENVRLIYWDYWNWDAEHYEEHIKTHQRFAKDMWFAGALWNWVGFAPHNRFSMEAGNTAIHSCLNNRVENLIFTMWGDDSAECARFSLLPALYHNAALLNEIDTDEMKEMFEKNVGIPFDDFLLLDYPGTQSDNLINNGDKYLFYNDPFQGIFDLAIPEDNGERFARCSEKLTPYCNHPVWGYLFETAKCLADVLELKANLGQRTREAYGAKNREDLEKLIEVYNETERRVERFYEAFERQWMRENKPHGFEVQDIRIGGVRQRLTHCAKRLRQYLDGEITSIPELEEELLEPFGTGREYKEQDFCENIWRRIVSTNVV